MILAALVLLFAVLVGGPANARPLAPSPTPALAAGPTALSVKTISSAGPLTKIHIGNDLSCQVQRGAGDGELFPPTSVPADCGTFIAVGGTLFAPDLAAHEESAAAETLDSTTPFAPVSQTPVSGAGTTFNPFSITTTVNVGATGLRIEQRDSYDIGSDSYRTEVAVTNMKASPVSFVLYRAGDCFLGGDDSGFGFTASYATSTGIARAAGCSMNKNNTPPALIEEWVSLTAGNSFTENLFSTVWSQVGSKTSLPNTCMCTTELDNGAGISWSETVAGGAKLVFAHETLFSPTGKKALVMSKKADSPSASAGAQDGYTITISNPNSTSVTIGSIVDALPAGFSYVSGSTTGVTTANPAISGGTLTWAGSFVVPKNGSITLHFKVRVASGSGTFFNRAGADAKAGYTVVPTGLTAPITVTPKPQGDHFQCYSVVHKGALTKAVSLSDQFGKNRPMKLKAPNELCAPVNKAGEAPQAPFHPAHLLCYLVKSGPAFAPRVVETTNQFTTAVPERLRVVRPWRLCLPTAKRLTGAGAAPAVPGGLGHYLCYIVTRVGPVRAYPTVSTRDQFGQRSAAVIRPGELCTPVQKRVAGKPPSPVFNTKTHYVCYQTSVGPVVNRTVWATNQFQSKRKLLVHRARGLCVPSFKKVLKGPA